MRYYLRQIERGNSNPLEINLTSNEVVVGRSTYVELTRYAQVSRRHVSFTKNVVNDIEQWYVQDLESLNGLYVNGFRIEGPQPHVIEIGDHIGFGVPNAEANGFVCTLTVRHAPIVQVKREIEVIDLSVDEPAIKDEPLDDYEGHVSNRASTSSASAANIALDPLEPPAKMECNKSNDMASTSGNSKIAAMSNLNVPLENVMPIFKKHAVPVKSNENPIASNAFNVASEHSSETNLTRLVLPTESIKKGIEALENTSKSVLNKQLSATYLNNSKSYIEQLKSSIFQSDPCCSKDLAPNFAFSEAPGSSTINQFGNKVAIVKVQDCLTNKVSKSDNIPFNNFHSKDPSSNSPFYKSHETLKSKPSSSTAGNEVLHSSVSHFSSKSLESEHNLQKGKNSFNSQNSARTNCNEPGSYTEISFNKKTSINQNTLVKQNTLSNAILSQRLRKCYISLKRCDSPDFDWPDDVRPKSFQQQANLYVENYYQQNNVNLKQKKHLIHKPKKKRRRLSSTDSSMSNSDDEQGFRELRSNSSTPCVPQHSTSKASSNKVMDIPKLSPVLINQQSVFDTSSTPCVPQYSTSKASYNKVMDIPKLSPVLINQQSVFDTSSTPCVPQHSTSKASYNKVMDIPKLSPVLINQQSVFDTSSTPCVPQHSTSKASYNKVMDIPKLSLVLINQQSVFDTSSTPCVPQHSTSKASYNKVMDIPKLSPVLINQQSVFDKHSSLVGQKIVQETRSSDCIPIAAVKPIAEIQPQISMLSENKNCSDSSGNKKFFSSSKGKSSEPLSIEKVTNFADSAFEHATDNNENNFCYSQIEDIITIDDDDSYFDFDNSQLVIKEEPLDQETSEQNLHPSIGDYFPMSQMNTHEEDSDDISNPAETLISPRNDSDSDSSVDNQNYTIEPFKKRELESEVPQNSAKKRVSKIKSVGKILLTEPQNMGRRPKHMRGREEWFEEKQLTNEQPTVKRPPPKLSTGKLKKQKPEKLKTPSKNKKLSMKTLIEKNNALDCYKIPKKTKPLQSPRKVMQPSTNNKPAAKIPILKVDPNSKRKSPAISARNSGRSRSDSLLSDMQVVSNKTNISRNKTVPSKKFSYKESMDKTATNNKPSEVPKSMQLSAGNTSSLPVTSFNFKKTLDIAGPSGKTYIEKPRVPDRLPTVTRSALSGPLVCPVLPSRISRDPRLNRTNTPLNNLMLKYNTNQTAVATPVQPIIQPFPVMNNLPSTSSHNLMQSGNRPIAIRHTPVTSIQDASSKQANFLGMIKRIVELNVKWLEEQNNAAQPPPAVIAGANTLPLYFNSLDQYIASFSSMLMVEVWDTLYEESKIIFEGNQRAPNKFYFVIVECESRDNMTVYKCESVVNKSSFLPSEGNVVILDVVDRNSKRVSVLLGYIDWHKVEEFHRSSMHPKWRKLGKLWLDDAKLWSFRVYVKNRGDKLVPVLDSLMKGNGISSIRNRVRFIDNLQLLQKSPFCRSILIPDEKTFFVKYRATSPLRGFNSSQRSIIEGVCEEVNKQAPEPKIILLQGPPGTGKTHTIIGLLEKLVFVQSSRPKILVTAPSNAAVDEIGCRLVDLNNRLKSRSQSIKFVRVGLPGQINPKMKPFTLDEKADQMLKARSVRKYNEEQIQKKQNEIDILKKQKSDYKTQQKIIDLEESLKVLKQQFLQQNSNHANHWKYKLLILQESDIVLSTLGSCNQKILTSVFQPNSTSAFTLCIIDEASQCTEVEALQVLNFGISKLLLVGDHQQLPATVNSKLASKFGFERSIFERFHLYFSKYFERSPIFMLTEQFRMHSEICRFPSKQFYNSRLITSPSIDIQYQGFPLQPYIVYDILISQEHDVSSSKTNRSEALAIVNLCTQLLSLNSRASIGIITPYQAQRSLYSNSFGHNPLYRHIEVNTVDGFQGREKDVIIVSCVRANGTSGGIGFLSDKKRLNVAITRAKQCLIICCHSNTLMQDSNWRDLIEDARERQLCRPVTSDKDIPLLFKPHRGKRR